MSVDDGLTRDYRVAFLGYLPRREEAALHRGYQLGRSAVTEGLSILELAQTHHQVFLEVLQGTASDDVPEVAHAASEFFLEVLATFAMTRSPARDDRPPADERLEPPGDEGPRPGSGGRARRPRVRSTPDRAIDEVRPARS